MIASGADVRTMIFRGEPERARTSGTALQDACVCLRPSVKPNTEKRKLNKQVQRTSKFAHVLKFKVDMMDPSLYADESTECNCVLRKTGRLLTDSTIKSRKIVEFALGKGHA